MREEANAQVGERPLPHPARQVRLQRREAERGEPRGDERKHDPDQGLEVAGLDALVDGELREERRHQGDERVREERDDRADRACPVRHREADEHSDPPPRLRPGPVGDPAAPFLREVCTGLPDLQRTRRSPGAARSRGSRGRRHSARRPRARFPGPRSARARARRSGRRGRSSRAGVRSRSSCGRASPRSGPRGSGPRWSRRRRPWRRRG